MASTGWTSRKVYKQKLNNNLLIVVNIVIFVLALKWSDLFDSIGQKKIENTFSYVANYMSNGISRKIMFTRENS